MITNKNTSNVKCNIDVIYINYELHWSENLMIKGTASDWDSIRGCSVDYNPLFSIAQPVFDPFMPIACIPKLLDLEY